jgi:translocation and assembly module TamA
MALGSSAQVFGVMAVTLLAACASQQKQAAPVVRDLEISGNEQIPSRKIENKILTSDTGWWPFARKRYFDPVTWQGDLERIERLYVANGFYQAEIVKDEVVPKPPDGVNLKVQVKEGSATHIGKLEIRGLDLLPAEERKAVLEDLPLAPGAVFREADWEAAKRRLVERLRNRGYAKVEVDARALVDVKTRQATLALNVDTGRHYQFGDIQVDTAPGARIAPVIVWEQVRLAIRDGRPYSDEAMEEAERRVFGLGVFGTAKVTAGEPDEATARIPIKVVVREAPFRTLRLGGGARFDQIRNEARLIGDWTNRDFLGGMRKLTLHAEAGWAFIPSAYSVIANNAAAAPRNGPIARARVEFEQPRFLGRPSLRERNSLEFSHTLEQAYIATSGRLMTGVVWQAHSTLSVFPAYRLEADYLQGPPVSGAATAPLVLGCQSTTDNCFIWLSYVDVLTIWDRRDNALEPHDGTYVSLSLHQGGVWLGGDFEYVRAMPDARIYRSFGDDDELTLAARVRVGELWTFSGNPDDSAVVTRFYAGGGVSMRGFADRRLSPLLLAPAPNGDPNVLITMPIGGNGVIDSSFEARYTISSSFRLAAFVDAAQVTRGRLGLGDVRDVLVAVGVGLRWLTPVGPIRLDIARRLPFGRLPTLFQVNMAGDIVEVPYAANDSCFGLGGSSVVTPVADTQCALHISIGEAF